MVTLMFNLLVLSAVVISLVIASLLVMWLSGVDSLAFPGIGLLVGTPALVILFTVLEFIIVVVAMFVARYKADIPTIMSV